jgi:RNA polymerase sigma-70 factor (ECF subfamily)
MSLILATDSCPAGLLGWTGGFATQAPPRKVSAMDADGQDVRQSLNGDGDAYRRIIQRHQAAVARRLIRFSRDPRVLEELVHETFVQAYFSLPKYRSAAPLEHWLHRIAVRVGYRYWTSRRDQRQMQSLDGQAIAAPAAPDSPADREAIDAVLTQLPPRDRLVITLLYLEDHSIEQAAQLTGWTRTMVKVQAFRARRKLKKIMEHGRHGGSTKDVG